MTFLSAIPLKDCLYGRHTGVTSVFMNTIPEVLLRPIIDTTVEQELTAMLEINLYNVTENVLQQYSVSLKYKTPHFAFHTDFEDYAYNYGTAEVDMILCHTICLKFP